MSSWRYSMVKLPSYQSKPIVTGPTLMKIRPVTIGRNSGFGKSDFPNFMVTIEKKKSDFPTFLEISIRICHFRIDQKVGNSERTGAMYWSEKTKKPMYAVISGFSFQVPTRNVDPTSRINEFPI